MSASFWLGTDYLGRDVLAGIVRGARTSLAVGVTSTAIILALGILIGAAAGYYGGWVDEALMRATEFFQVLPAFLFAMVLVAIFSPTVTTIILAIGAWSIASWHGIILAANAEASRIQYDAAWAFAFGIRNIPAARLEHHASIVAFAELNAEL